MSLSLLCTLSFLTSNLPSAQGLCAQLHLQGFSAAGVRGGPRGIRLPPDAAPTSQGPTPAQLKLCGLWRCLGMPAGAGTAPVGALGLRACGDTIPGPWQDRLLPAVCAVARSEAPHLRQPPSLCQLLWLGGGRHSGCVHWSLATCLRPPRPSPGSFTRQSPPTWSFKSLEDHQIFSWYLTWGSPRDFITLLDLISVSWSRQGTARTSGTWSLPKPLQVSERVHHLFQQCPHCPWGGRDDLESLQHDIPLAVTTREPLDPVL